MIFITFCDGFERLSVQKHLFVRPENVWASRNNCLRVRKTFGRAETIVCAPGNVSERFLLASGICSERPETFVCASGKHADVPASVVGFGGTTDVRDYATGEALTHPRVGGDQGGIPVRIPTHRPRG